MRRLFLLMIMLAAGTSAARADEARLSDRGRRMISGMVGGTWYNGEDLPSAASSRYRWALWVEPSFVYFIQDRVGIGAYLGYQSTHGDFVEQEIRYVDNHVSTGLNTSFEVIASNSWGWFLNMNLGYAWAVRRDRFSPTSSTGFFPDRLKEHERRFQVGVRLPVTYHVSPSVGLGLGPDLLFEFVTFEAGNRSDSALRTRVGASSWIAYSF